jgi:predicted kinase
MPNLIITAGIPGSGKSTWARSFFDLKYTIISADAIRLKLFGSLVAAHEGDRAENNRRVFAEHTRLVRDALSHNVDVIVDNTSLTPRSREEQRALADEYEAKCHLILFTDLQTAIARNSMRQFIEADAFVPLHIMESMVKQYYDTVFLLMTGERSLYTSVTEIGHYE